MKKLNRAQGGAPRRNTKDRRGRVKVSIALMEKGLHARGNVHRSMTLENCTVTEVFTVISALLTAPLRQ